MKSTRLAIYCFERQVPVPINYEGLVSDEGFRLDLLVEDILVVELKAVDNRVRFGRHKF